MDGTGYLDKILKILRNNRKECDSNQIPIGTVYDGFKTISIQKLARKAQP